MKNQTWYNKKRKKQVKTKNIRKLHFLKVNIIKKLRMAQENKTKG